MLDSEVSDYLDFEQKLSILQESTNSQKIEEVLKYLWMIDFSSLWMSLNMLDAIVNWLTNIDNENYFEYIIDLVSKLVNENIPVTHEFIDRFINWSNNHKNNERYIENIKAFVQKYDQYWNSEILEIAVREIKDANENIWNLWIHVLLDFSKRNVKFSDEILLKLLDYNWISKNEEAIFEILKNAIGNLDKTSDETNNCLENLFISEVYQTKILILLIEATKNGAKISDKLISNLLMHSQQNLNDSKYIFEIFMNLNKNQHQVPQEVSHIGEFISYIHLIKKKDESYSSKNDGISKIIELEKDYKLSQLITYDSLIVHLEALIKEHTNSQLSINWMKAILHFWSRKRELLDQLNWIQISEHSKYPEFWCLIFDLFEYAVENEIKFPPGVCSRISNWNDKGIKIYCLNLIINE